jgi:hypothetical protein
MTVQIAFIVLLGLIVAISMVVFAVLGAMHLRRTQHLVQDAHTAGLRFSPEDPFDVPRRYSDFALMHMGHNPRANNVTYGRIGRRPARAFDFRYEAGHGTRRATRQYSVITVDVELPLPFAILWNEADLAAAPLPVLAEGKRIGGWFTIGDEGVARVLVRACAALVDEGISVQTGSGALLFCSPVRRWRDHTTDRFGAVHGILDRLEAWCENDAGENSTKAGR